MKKLAILLAMGLVLALAGCGQTADEPNEPETTRPEGSDVTHVLPPPSTTGNISVEQALAARRSRRDFDAGRALTPAQLGQILWAAYGITQPDPNPNLRGGLRTTPSAGATFPLEIYAIVGNVEGIASGVYRYDAAEHMLIQVVEGDVRAQLTEAALRQGMVQQAPVTVFFAAIMERATAVYGDRGMMYVHMEIGHAAQNVYLQAEAMGLGTCAVGAFIDEQLRDILRLPAEEVPLYLMPVGYVR